MGKSTNKPINIQSSTKTTTTSTSISNHTTSHINQQEQQPTPTKMVPVPDPQKQSSKSTTVVDDVKTVKPAMGSEQTKSPSAVEDTANKDQKKMAQAVPEISAEKSTEKKPKEDKKEKTVEDKTTEEKDQKDSVKKQVEKIESKEKVTTVEEKNKVEDDKDMETKDVVFEWTHSTPGQVMITGSFTEWTDKVELNNVDGKYQVNMQLKPGKYSYKFIVDDEWCYDVTCPTETDESGNVNNVITVA